MFSRHGGAALAAAVGVAVLLVGCGGGGSSARLTKAQYEQRVQKDAAALTKATGGISSNVTSVGALQKVITSAQSSLDAAAKDLESLTPPKEAEAANKAFIAALKEIGTKFKAMAAALKSNDMTKILGLVQKLSSSNAVTAARTAAADLAKKGYDLGAFNP